MENHANGQSLLYTAFALESPCTHATVAVPQQKQVFQVMSYWGVIPADTVSTVAMQQNPEDRADELCTAGCWFQPFSHPCNSCMAVAKLPAAMAQQAATDLQTGN